ncbi:alkaline phosphatase family protein [Paenibacillus xerothermodurans]|uniref:Alkaline phosphatase family protein n=2 Tax=Paenibacillus xerothermodurans TaxID=1977292 RepID=A0A2W1N7B0_PAEXE|nr:alkaline phosphatase family protein [Paenibacillus xerothermodurans]
MCKHRIPAIAVLLAVVLLIGCTKQQPHEHDLSQMKSSNGAKAVKPVILIMVDSLLSSSIDRGIQQNILPTFRYLADHGQYYKEFVSSFPTMSVTIDSTLLTGTYPDKHRVPGLVWYSANDKTLINYGTGTKDVMQRGINPFLQQTFFQLNDTHLSKQITTIYEDLAAEGRQSGSINGIIYRGSAEHTLTFPSWLHGTTSLPAEQKVKGPDFFTLGAFSNPLAGVIDLKVNMTQQFGINNQYAADVASYLIKNNHVPDLLCVYMPDLDAELHEDGPSHMDTLKDVDQQLNQIMQSYGSRDEALRQAVFILVGDSGVTPVRRAGEQAVIELPDILMNYEILTPGDTATDQTEVALASNEDMAYVYNLNAKYSMRDIADDLRADNRIDIVAWKENGWIYVMKGGTQKEMQYRPNGDVHDTYNQSWTVQNDVDVLDLQWDRARHTVQYGDYPDALQRLSAALHSHQGDFLVVTSKYGYELADKNSRSHTGGGAHGSLHRWDSLVPVLICGTERAPKTERMVDMKSYFLELTGAAGPASER